MHGKLSPRFVGPFEILDKVREVVYQLVLPQTLSSLYNIFHISMLRKYIPDLSHAVEYEPLHLHKDLTYKEVLISIIDKKDQVLQHRTIPYMKV